MIEVDEALFDRLSGDPELMGLLAPYQGGKALLTVAPIPPGVEPPFVVIPATLADTPGPGDTKNSVGRRWVRDIGCYARAAPPIAYPALNRAGDPRYVERIAERVRSLFHRHKLAIAGYATLVAEVQGPYNAPTDKTIYGRIVTVTLTAMAN